MTACVNKKHTRRVALAISASLVGALSLGAAAPVFAEGVETLSVAEGFTVEGGAKATAAKTNEEVEISDLEDYAFVDGTDEYPIITEVTDGSGNPVDVTDRNSYVATYYRDLFDGTDAKIGAPESFTWQVGDYHVDIEAVAGPYAGQTFTYSFKVVPSSLDDAVIYDGLSGDMSDSAFTFRFDENDPSQDGAQDFNFALNGVDITGQVVVTYFNRGEVDSADAIAAPVLPGKYTAVITGEVDGVFEGERKEIDFEIDKLDIADAVVQVYDGTEPVTCTTADTLPTMVSIDGHSCTDGTWVYISLSTGVYMENKNYVFDVAVNEDNENAAARMTGSTTVSLDKVQEKVFSQTITYVTGYAPDADVLGQHDIVADLSVTDPANPLSERFDASKIVVWATDGTRIPNSQLDVTYTNADTGEPATEADMQTPGNWIVTVQVDAAATGYAYGSDPQSMNVSVTSGTIKTEEGLYFTYKGATVAQDIVKYYTGVDYLDSIGTVLKYGDETLVEGVDYEVTVTDSDGNEVDEIVDAGTYTITVTSDSYTLDGSTDNTGDNAIDVTVKPVEVGTLYPVTDDMKVFGEDGSFIPYTGEDIDCPALAYQTIDEDGAPLFEADGTTPQLTLLPEDSYVVEDYSVSDQVNADGTALAGSPEYVQSINAEGHYVVQIRNVRGVTNYLITANTSLPFEVRDADVFSDVPSTYWGAESIYDAAEQGYIKGVAGTSLFKPESAITRADAVVVIFRMAGADQYYIEHPEMSTEDLGGYMTRYSDVDEGAYYAKAIAWATKVDIAHGDAGADTFRPEDTITREEFAALLKNYAAAMGDYVAAGDDALAEFPDAGEVSSWMTEAVAWAAENGVMGNRGELNPTDNVKRAEVAAMAVNYQPEALTQDDILVDVPVLH